MEWVQVHAGVRARERDRKRERGCVCVCERERRYDRSPSIFADINSISSSLCVGMLWEVVEEGYHDLFYFYFFFLWPRDDCEKRNKKYLDRAVSADTVGSTENQNIRLIRAALALLTS